MTPTTFLEVFHDLLAFILDCEDVESYNKWRFTAIHAAHRSPIKFCVALDPLITYNYETVKREDPLDRYPLDDELKKKTKRNKGKFVSNLFSFIIF